ncbi:hypothetical protein QVG61_11745 [Thiohalobacter sp. IOR34]|uniref:hypothetical protein n=1 Tax=Thiohalobacter sp. IOR34 TaxID=3057176 RepID=UPI0025AFED23|nr:hypothetical protein [Thiohalobacter sp. IOR34]WJW75150.1 hypothetical protein QVG61_11745 [Thiohalobacter sp. IOR34]
MNRATDGSGGDPYLSAFRGSFYGVLRWPQLDALWDSLRSDAEGWYIYAVGEPPPERPADAERLLRFIEEIDALLRREHEEDYCGIVYTDAFETPTFIKIFDPNNLGVSCGFSDNPPLPGWVLSKMKPADLQADTPLPGNRRRWWQRLLGG